MNAAQGPGPAPPAMNNSAQPFTEPPLFRLRLVGLCVFTCISLAVLSIFGLTIPAVMGRFLLGLITGSARLHELYTILTGLYILWLITRIISFIRSLLPFNIHNLLTRLKTYSILCARVMICTFLLIGYVPFMIGLASELGKLSLFSSFLARDSFHDCQSIFVSFSFNHTIKHFNRSNSSSHTTSRLDYWFTKYKDCNRYAESCLFKISS